ncbi:UNVERIFIED_CONTAM: Ethylene-responsive transcription factor WRI1, partial [Sesamum radiatum]
TQEEAAAAYDIAAIEFRGPNAVTNFDISNYADKLKKILPELQVKHEDLQVKEETNLESIDEVQADEAHDAQEDGSQQVQPNIPKLELIDSTDHSHAMMVMDPTDQHEHPWDLCLDTDGFNALPLPDIPLERASEMLGWLDDKCFEDNIECIFDGPLYNNELLQDAMSGTASDILVDRESKGQELSGSASSSSLSTMASVCSNI